MSSIPPDPEVLPRSLVEAWRADTASSSELCAGYARFSRRRTTRSAVPRVAGFVGGVLVRGIGLAQAASLVPASWLGLLEATPNPPHAAVPSAGVKPSVFEKRGSAPVAPPVPLRVQPVPAPATPPAASTPPAPAPAPRVRRAPGAVSAPQPYVDEQWQRAASALRDDDFDRARSALLEIERSAGAVEGDAARLARAQLLASHGRNAQALELARALAERAESALVRDNARRLVARLIKEESAGTDRSTERAGADK